MSTSYPCRDRSGARKHWTSRWWGDARALRLMGMVLLLGPALALSALDRANAGLIGSSMEGDGSGGAMIPFHGVLDTTAEPSSLRVVLEYVDSSEGRVLAQYTASSVAVSSRSGTLTYGFEVSDSDVHTLSGGEWSLRVDARRTTASVVMNRFEAAYDGQVVSGSVPSRDISRTIGEGLLSL